jgi:hypothetical protein
VRALTPVLLSTSLPIVGSSGVSVRLFCLHVKTPPEFAGKALVSHGAETCPHARKVLFRALLSHLHPGRSELPARETGRHPEGT